MTQRVARDPGLELEPAGVGAAPPWASGPDGVTIGAARCASCGAVQVPFQTLGCRRCGSTDLARRDLPASGTLLASVVVWRHPTRAVPYTLGEIELDSGPTVVALLADRADQDAATAPAPAPASPTTSSARYRPGALVRCTTLSDEDPPLPVFALAQEQETAQEQEQEPTQEHSA